jgi:hypothetical protein
MTIGAGGLAFIAIQNYQEQAREAGSAGTRQLSAVQNTLIKVERVSNGKVYVRNSGTEPLREIAVFVDGTPITVAGPDVCQPKALCVFEVGERVSCDGECTITIGTASGASMPSKVEEVEVLSQRPPAYSDWSVNTSSITYGEAVLVSITWDSGISSCTLVDGCYGFSNQTLTTLEAESGEWG